MDRIDWKKLDEFERGNAERICRHFLTLGKKVSQEWKLGDTAGAKGDSLGVQLTGDRAGLWVDRATGEGGKLRKLIAANRGLADQDVVEEISRAFGISFRENGGGTQNDPFDWQSCVMAMAGSSILRELETWRGFSREFCAWLVTHKLLGLYKGLIAFPVQGAGNVVSPHYLADREAKRWRYFKGTQVSALIIGELKSATEVHVFESTWDALALLDRSGAYRSHEVSAVITRGVDHAKKVRGIIPAGKRIYAWPQNDKPDIKTGKVPSEEWFSAIKENLEGQFFRVQTPPERADVNDWTLNGASKADLDDAIKYSKPVGEEPEPTINWSEISINAPSSQYDNHKAVYPPDSILEDYMQFVRDECESADCFILGSILPVCAAQLGRRVRFPWGSIVKFPNLFAMLAGPAGDRKSSAIEIARSIASDCLPESAFLPGNFSPESLFDEYDTEKGGRPDKLWIVDDANITLTDWRQTSNGDRVASRFLALYDCGGLTENFRRNKEKNQPVTRRTIPQTSTSIIFGGTFNVACFQGQAVRAGMARRFIFYVAEGFGRTIQIPEARENSEFAELSEMFSRLNGFSTNMDFAPEAKKLWIDYQNDNRDRKSEANPLNDAECSRLSSEPMQTLSLSMIFQACACAKQASSLGSISRNVLQSAIDHMAQNLESARFLDSIADRESARNSAEILLSKIRKDFQVQSRGGTILLRRTDITCTYAPHSSRLGAWTPNDIFLKFMPILIRQGDARLFEKKGKTEVYAFRDQD